MREGVAAYRATGSELEVPYRLCVLAEVHAKAGQAAAALRVLDEASALMERTGERWYEAELHRLTGMALLGLPEPDRVGAEASFSRAMAIARAQGTRLWELRGATSLARIWAEQGERRRAQDVLAPIYGWFTEGSDTPDLVEAKALLDELASVPQAVSDTGRRRVS
jgi:predicted ATPase